MANADGELWTPVEHRMLGLDRRTFAPGLVALVIALLLIYGLPAINAAAPWHNEVRAGSVLDLGGGATAVPPVGWQLERGALVGQDSPTAGGADVLLVKGGVSIALVGAKYQGSATAFLDQVERSGSRQPLGVEGPRSTVHTTAGLIGVARSDTRIGNEALDVGFKLATGGSATLDAAPALLVQVRATAGQFAPARDQINALLLSIAPGDRP